jgi:SAM-dependent methyltransferase
MYTIALYKSSSEKMSDKSNLFYNLLNYPFLFNIVRSLLDSGQVKYLKTVLLKYNIQNVLDIGCGCGFFSQITDGKYLGIDYNRNFIDYCRKKFGTADKRFVQSDAMTFDIDGKYDTSIIINSIHHFTDLEVLKILQKMKEVTERFVVIHDLVPLNNFVSKFFYKIDRGKYIRSLECQKALIQKAGITIKEILFLRRFPWVYLHSTFICAFS